MATPRKAAAAPAETPEIVPEPDTQVETDSVAAQLDRAQLGLLEVINDAVSKDGHGVDIVLAQQAADVYKSLFGETR
jgi:hypothetical protein